MYIIKKILQTQESRKIWRGVSYLLSEKLFKVLVGLIIHSYMARYLSPTNFGRMGYIINFATAFLPITLLGLEDVGIKKILKSKVDPSEVVSSILVIRFISFLIVTFLAALILIFQSEQLALTTWLFCVIYNFIGCFYTLEIPFLSSVNNRNIFASRTLAYIFGSSLKLLGIYQNFGFKFILTTYLLEELVGKFIIARHYFKHFYLKIEKFRFLSLHEYIRPSFWIVLGSFCMIIENKLGFLVMENLNDTKSLGFFTASYMLVDLWTFVPLAILSAVLPTLVQLHTVNQESYIQKIQDIHGLIFGIQFVFIISVWIVSPYLIRFLYGTSFLGAETFLRWQSLSVLISFIQVLRMRWFLIENSLIVWTVMNFFQLMLTCFLVFLCGFGQNIRELVLVSIISHIFTNIIFMFRFELVERSLKFQLLSIKYSFRLTKKIWVSL